MTTHKLEVPGRPVSWARTATHQGRRITPKKQRDHQRLVAELGSLVRPKVYVESGPIHVKYEFQYRRPRNPTHEEPCGVPDIDNLVKQINDGLQDVWFKNDSQIVRIEARKMYGPKDVTRVHLRAI